MPLLAVVGSGKSPHMIKIQCTTVHNGLNQVFKPKPQHIPTPLDRITMPTMPTVTTIMTIMTMANVISFFATKPASQNSKPASQKASKLLVKWPGVLPRKQSTRCWRTRTRIPRLRPEFESSCLNWPPKSTQGCGPNAWSGASSCCRAPPTLQTG